MSNNVKEMSLNAVVIWVAMKMVAWSATFLPQAPENDYASQQKVRFAKNVFELIPMGIRLHQYCI